MITPAAPDSKAGNRATAERWKILLERSAHNVSIVTAYHGEACDLLLALHAWRSYEAIRLFRNIYPDMPLIVALTGTDIYRHQYEYPEQTLYSMQAADALIGLHTQVGDDIPERFLNKLVTLFQSADLPTEQSVKTTSETGFFDVCVIGHLRNEKDSLRAAWAARRLPEHSCVRVSCAGKPHNEYWQSLAQQEMMENSRFRWLGELEKKDTAKLMANSQILVMSSVMEGGANVISEACLAGLPVIASDIAGNTGLLGKEYLGYYPVGNTQALTSMLGRVENDGRFLEQLRGQVDQLANQFMPEKEQVSLEQALSLALQRCSGNTF